MNGAYLHAIHWLRFLFIISLSVPAVGLFLLAYADYFENRSDREPAYRDFCRTLGRQLAMVGFVIALIFLLGWQITNGLPSTSAPNWLSEVSTMLLGWLLFIIIAVFIWGLKRSPKRGYFLLASGFSILGILAIWRESIRMTHLSVYGYFISDYTVNVDFPSLILFFSTFIGVGGLVGSFYLTLLYRAGRVAGEYTADKFVARLGTAAVTVLAVWITTFFTYGISIWVYDVFTF